MKVIFLKKHPFLWVRGKWANLFAPCKRNMAIYKIDFGRFLAIQHPQKKKKHLILG
jgi:hypothetical protein